MEHTKASVADACSAAFQPHQSRLSSRWLVFQFDGPRLVSGLAGSVCLFPLVLSYIHMMNPITTCSGDFCDPRTTCTTI